MKIEDFLEVKTIVTSLDSTTKKDVIGELAGSISSTHSNINPERLVEALLEREKLCSTAVDSGVAVPHAKISGITDIVLGFGRSLEGIVFDSLDKQPTHFFITLIAPEDTTSTHIQMLARISKIFKDPELRSKLLQCESEQEIYEAIISEDSKY